jgi:hypothetical protein
MPPDPSVTDDDPGRLGDTRSPLHDALEAMGAREVGREEHEGETYVFIAPIRSPQADESEEAGHG